MCTFVSNRRAGEFGIVYKAILNNWKGEGIEQVAVKTLKGKLT